MEPTKPILALVLTLTLVCLSHQQPKTPPQSKCLEELSKVLTACVTEAGLTPGNFFWFVTNGTSQKSEAPTDPVTFKPKICGAQQKIGACTVHKLGPIINSTICSGATNGANYVDLIQSELGHLFLTYDSKCMHPCRQTLIQDIRQCYSTNGIEPNLFASETSNGAVIGTTEAQSKKFCSAKDKLVPCMQSKVDACPEAPQILQTVGIDFTIFSKVVNLLCAHSQAYISSLTCVAASANEADHCQQRHAQSMMQLDIQAKEKGLPEEKYLASMCENTIEQIKCDMSAWSKKRNNACSRSDVVEFRRTLACEFLSPPCKANTNLMNKQDNPCSTNYKKTEQKNLKISAI